MITKDRRQKTLKSSSTRDATEALRSAPGSVDREGGKYGAGIIHGVSAITRGEALGHGYWIDDDFLASVEQGLNDGSRKARFRHPGLSSDGLGTALGVVEGAKLEGGKVVTDLHFLEAAHDSPEGDLASYVMKLAEESPELFGTSIVFAFDHDAATAHAEEHGAELVSDPVFGQYLDLDDFESPDPGNTNNLPHARLKALKAVDVVDDPAANPEGMFASLNEEGEMVEAFDDALEYAFGLSDVEPPPIEGLEFSPARVRGFVERFATARGMEITFTNTPKHMLKTKRNEQVDGLKTQVADLEAALDTKESELQAARDEIATLSENQSAAKDAADKASGAGEPSESLEDSVLSLSVELQNLRKEVEGLNDKAEAKAIEKLAEMGHPPVEVPADDIAPAPALSELETYEAMETGEEKRAYLAANKITIQAQAKARR